MMGPLRLIWQIAAIIGSVSVASCGFKPLYGDLPGSVSSEELATVRIGLIADRTGQQLRNRLLSRMQPRGASSDPVYVLDVELTESAIGIAVRRDETATRTNLTISATLALTEIASEDVVLVDNIKSYASYDILTAEYATLNAERDARDRALVELGDRIASRVSLFLIRPE